MRPPSVSDYHPLAFVAQCVSWFAALAGHRLPTVRFITDLLWAMEPTIGYHFIIRVFPDRSGTLGPLSQVRAGGSSVLFMALLALPFSAASAATFPSFTLNPAAVPLNGTQFSADNIVVSDFSTINYTSGTPSTARNFTDVGFLPIAQFQNGGAFAAAPGLNNPGGYGLYFQFSGTGSQGAPSSNGSVAGTLNALTFNFYGFNETVPATFSPDGTTTTGVINPVLLSTGTLINGNVFINQTTPGPIPGASALVAFTPVAAEQKFFVAPNPFYLGITTSFTNTFTAIGQTASGFTITNGGGQANFLPTAIPEPASMLVVAAGLGAVGLMRRRARA